MGGVQQHNGTGTLLSHGEQHTSGMLATAGVRAGQAVPMEVGGGLDPRWASRASSESCLRLGLPDSALLPHLPAHASGCAEPGGRGSGLCHVAPQ